MNRLDQTDALVEQLPGDRAKLEHNASRGHAYPMEAQANTRAEPVSYAEHGVESDTESDQLDWDPEHIDDGGYPLVDEYGSTLVPVPRDGLPDESEASSLTAWARTGKSEKICAILSLDEATTSPSQAAPRKECEKPCLEKSRQDETETFAHRSGTKRKNKHSTERITTAKLRKRTRCYRCQQIGHLVRECQNPATKDNHQAPAKGFFHARRCFCPVTQSCLLHVVQLCVRVLEEHIRFETQRRCWFDLGTSSWPDGHWSPAACCGNFSCSTMA